MNHEPDSELIHKHHLHSPYHRGFYTSLLIISVLGIGTIGMHIIEGFSYLDSFYFISMIATGQGPPPALNVSTATGKIFVSLMAFLSVGSMVASFGFLFGPFLGKLWRIGVFKFEKELHHLSSKK